MAIYLHDLFSRRRSMGTDNFAAYHPETLALGDHQALSRTNDKVFGIASPEEI